MDLTGRHLGKYKLLENVGQGGMAYVYKAYQPTIDRHVAVKVLHSHLAENAEFLARFKREAQGLGRLRHPHIVSVIDFDVDDGWYYMVMDFIEGETLEAVLDRHGKLPVAEALRLAAQLAGALDYAHGNGRIHRDVKPGNVMFADAARQHAVITDFGLTRLLDDASITLSGTIAGTPAYMSPEAAQGQKVDARSDIYSLGVMLYEMVTGQRPYLGETPLSVIMKLVLEPLPPARTVNPDLPQELEDVLQKAMAKRPEDRYQTAVELRAAVQEVVSGENTSGLVEPGQTPILLPKVDPMPASEPSCAKRKRPFLSIAAGLSLLAVLILTGFFFLDGQGAEADVLATAAEETAAVDTAAPTLAVIVPNETPPLATAVPVPAGTLRFAESDSNKLRQYTLSLDEVPPLPSGFHYELWFDFAGQSTPENVAEVAAQNGRITYADVLVDSLAATVTAVRISLEPDFDDDPSISTEVVYAGAVAAEAGLAEIHLFAAE